MFADGAHFANTNLFSRTGLKGAKNPIARPRLFAPICESRALHPSRAGRRNTRGDER